MRRWRGWIGAWTLAAILAAASGLAAFTNTWDETAPAGSALASTIDDHIRQLKLDVRERLAASSAAWNTGNITLAPTAVTSPALTITSGTYTTDINVVSVTNTWNAAGVTFTGLEWNTTNTASAANSLLFDFQVGGSSKGKLDKDGDLTIAGNLVVSGAGPHAIGAAANADFQLLIQGTLVGSTGATGIGLSNTLTVPAGQLGRGLLIAPTLEEASSGVHVLMTGATISPIFQGGSATMTDAVGLYVFVSGVPAGTTNGSTLKIAGPPSGASNNYSLWSVSGGVRFGSLGAFVASDKYVVIDSNGNLHVSALGPAS